MFFLAYSPAQCTIVTCSNYAFEISSSLLNHEREISSLTSYPTYEYTYLMFLVFVIWATTLNRANTQNRKLIWRPRCVFGN